MVEFDDSESVPLVYLSFYGNFRPALTKLDEVTSALPWKLKVY